MWSVLEINSRVEYRSCNNENDIRERKVKKKTLKLESFTGYIRIHNN